MSRKLIHPLSAYVRGPLLRAVAAMVVAITSTLPIVAQISTGSAPSSSGDTSNAPGTTAPTLVITDHPKDATTTAFVDASFAVRYSGQSLPSVHWQFSADGSNWNDVPGATTALLVVRQPVVAHDGTHWRARLALPGSTPLFSNPATLRVRKADALVRLDGLLQTFDGSPKSVTASTVPPGLSVSIRYHRDGAQVAQPTEPGTYQVVVDASGPNHAARTEETMVVK